MFDRGRLCYRAGPFKANNGPALIAKRSDGRAAASEPSGKRLPQPGANDELPAFMLLVHHLGFAVNYREELPVRERQANLRQGTALARVREKRALERLQPV